jgi:hypothetical protein
MSQPKGTGTFWEDGKLVERDDDVDPDMDARIARNARLLGAARLLKNHKKVMAKTPGRKHDEAAMVQLMTHLFLLMRTGFPPGLPPNKLADILTSEFPEHYPSNDALGRPGEKARNLLRKLNKLMVTM